MEHHPKLITVTSSYSHSQTEADFCFSLLSQSLSTPLHYHNMKIYISVLRSEVEVRVIIPKVLWQSWLALVIEDCCLAFTVFLIWSSLPIDRINFHLQRIDLVATSFIDNFISLKRRKSSEMWNEIRWGFLLEEISSVETSKWMVQWLGRCHAWMNCSMFGCKGRSTVRHAKVIQLEWCVYVSLVTFCVKIIRMYVTIILVTVYKSIFCVKLSGHVLRDFHGYSMEWHECCLAITISSHDLLSGWHYLTAVWSRDLQHGCLANSSHDLMSGYTWLLSDQEIYNIAVCL